MLLRKSNITAPCRLYNTLRGSSCDLMNDFVFPTQRAAVTVSAKQIVLVVKNCTEPELEGLCFEGVP